MQSSRSYHSGGKARRRLVRPKKRPPRPLRHVRPTSPGSAGPGGSGAQREEQPDAGGVTGAQVIAWSPVVGRLCTGVHDLRHGRCWGGRNWSTMPRTTGGVRYRQNDPEDDLTRCAILRSFSSIGSKETLRRCSSAATFADDLDLTGRDGALRLPFLTLHERSKPECRLERTTFVRATASSY